VLPAVACAPLAVIPRAPPGHSVARGFGLVLNFFGVLVLLLSCRSLLTRLRSTAASAFLPIDGAMPLSVAVVGYAMAALAVVHGVCHLVGGLTPGAPAVGGSSGWTGWTRAVVTGCVALALLGTVVVTSLPAVRQRHFELFSAASTGGGALLFLALLLHGSWGGHFTTWKWLAAPLLIHAVDVGGRAAATRRGTAALSFASGDVVFVSPDVVRLALPRVFDYRPGQYAEVRVLLAGGGPLRWHPFTIASAPHEEQMVFFIKVAGDWTHRLHTLVELARREGDEGLEVHVRGPFGAPASCTASYERVLLVGGGVGCTPFISYVVGGRRGAAEGGGVFVRETGGKEERHDHLFLRRRGRALHADARLRPWLVRVPLLADAPHPSLARRGCTGWPSRRRKFCERREGSGCPTAPRRPTERAATTASMGHASTAPRCRRASPRSA